MDTKAMSFIVKLDLIISLFKNMDTIYDKECDNKMILKHSTSGIYLLKINLFPEEDWKAYIAGFPGYSGRILDPDHSASVVKQLYHNITNCKGLKVDCTSIEPHRLFITLDDGDIFSLIFENITDHVDIKSFSYLLTP